MPLTNNNDETFPMGLAFDFRSTKPILEGEKKLPPAPMMMLLSTDGVLCPYYVVNQTPNVDQGIIRVPEPLPLGGQRKAIASKAGDELYLGIPSCKCILKMFRFCNPNLSFFFCECTFNSVIF